MSEFYKASELTRWSRLVRIRDEGVCQLCGGKFDIWRMQSHHIYPKSLYPEKALELENGIAVCTGCHQGSVHRGNTFKDVDPENENSGWRFFVLSFMRYTRLAAQRQFNEARQGEIRPTLAI